MSEQSSKEYEIRVLLSDILKCTPEDISSEWKLNEPPIWDSFTHLEIMLRLAENFGIEITEDTVVRYSFFRFIVADFNSV